MKKYIWIFIGVLIVASLVFYWVKNKPQPSIPSVKPIEKHQIAYKINIDTLQLRYDKVKSNQNLAQLLSGYVSGQIIDKISKETTTIFDVRKIRIGQRYAKIFTGKTPQKLLYFIYEINPIDYIVYNFSDSLRVYPGKKEIRKIVKTATGTIKSSLWNTFEENDLDINLALHLADVYSWTVDFYGLQKGDNFKVIYEEIYVDSLSTGSDRILAALFNSSGKPFYSFYFEQKGMNGYFDEHAQSLQRSFLKAPLRFSRISSRFSRSRMHPILRIVRPHFGVDYAAPRGTPVVSLGDGRVNELGWKGGYGRFIGIRHNSVYSSTYAHLSGYAKGLHEGSVVKQGDLIGYVGSSGLATGPHLDFRVYHNGTPVDPLKLESPPTEPVGNAFMSQYMQMVLKLKARVDSVK